MKTNELRIGNWIKTTDEVFRPGEQTVHKIENNHINNYHYSFCEPIPLTEEWLAKLGFEGIDEDGLWQRPDNECFQIQLPTLDEEIQHIWDAAFTGAPCQFVHQLQNLYFSLTGEELKII